MEDPNFEKQDSDLNEMASKMIRIMESGCQPSSVDPAFATPSDAYLTFLQLVRQTIPENKIKALIQARNNGPTLESALSPDFVANLAMQELREILKIPKA